MNPLETLLSRKSYNKLVSPAPTRQQVEIMMQEYIIEITCIVNNSVIGAGCRAKFCLQREGGGRKSQADACTDS